MPRNTPVTDATSDSGTPEWAKALARSTPHAPLMAPFMTYLVLLPLDGVFPDELRWIGMLIRGAVSLAVAWVFRPFYPPLGRPYWILSIVVGVFAAWGWVAGQHMFDRMGLGRPLAWGSLFSSSPTIFGPPHEPFNAAQRIESTAWFWVHVVAKIGIASTVVPIVEELFWRGLLLRAFVRWDDFEKVPLGTFTWFSFLATSLLSVLEHPANWGVSILCWFLFNGLFYLTRSLKCLILTHGITNLVLYIYVVYAGGDAWRFW